MSLIYDKEGLTTLLDSANSVADTSTGFVGGISFGKLWDLFGSKRIPQINTGECLMFYKIKEALASIEIETVEGIERYLDYHCSRWGWGYKVFGPDENGEGFTQPNFEEYSYHNNRAWIFQPKDPHGSFRDYAYTLVWRVTHEIAHGITNELTTQKYGEGTRQGALGVVTQWQDKEVPPLTLQDARRALFWEVETFEVQRELLHMMGITISDEELAKEVQVLAADVTYRILTGDFADPCDWGVVPYYLDPAQCVGISLEILEARAKQLEVMV